MYHHLIFSSLSYKLNIFYAFAFFRNTQTHLGNVHIDMYSVVFVTIIT